MFRARDLFKSFMVLGACVLASCSSVSLDAVSYGIFQDQDVRLAPITHGTADYLSHRAGDYLTTDMSIKALPLTNLRDPLLMTTFAKVIPERVGLRFSELGYPVDLSAVLTDEMNVPLHGASSGSADISLSGVYRRKDQEISVSMRLTDLSSGDVLSVHEFTLPLTKGLAEMAKPAASITKTTP